MTKRLAVTGVRKIEMEHADPVRAAKFYTDVWNLNEVVRADGAIYLRATCAAHHVLAIHPSNGPARVREIALSARDKGAVDALHARAKAAGFAISAPAERQTIDGGYGFSMRDPGGRRFSILTDARDHADDTKVRDRPYKIGHVNINTELVDQMVSFYTDVFGMRLVDHAGTQYFFNADSPDHCTLVLCKYGMETLNHIAYEMSDLDSVLRGAGRMHDAGYPIEWGPVVTAPATTPSATSPGRRNARSNTRRKSSRSTTHTSFMAPITGSGRRDASINGA